MGGNNGLSADNIKNAEKALAALKYYQRLGEHQRTKAEMKKVFDSFNNNVSGVSKDKLTSVDDIDEYFRTRMGLTVESSTMDLKYFEEHIDDWVDELVKYQAPPPAKPDKTPFKRVDTVTAINLADELFEAAKPDMGNNWLADTFAFDNDDDVRYKDFKGKFGQNGVNASNIVEVLDNLDLAEFRYAIHTFDDGDDLKALNLIRGTLQERANALKIAEALTPEDYKKVTDLLNSNELTHKGRDRRSEYASALKSVLNALRGVGVKD